MSGAIKPEKDTRSSSKVVPCRCKHEYQDKKYGVGKRIANLSRKHGVYRCTVCSTSHT